MAASVHEELVLLHGDRRLPVPPAGLTVGRDADNDVVLDDPAASRRHAIVHVGPAGLELEDCGSTNGTRLNGELVHGERVRLPPGAVVEIGDQVLRLLGGEETRLHDAAGQAEAAAWALNVGDGPLRLGRDPANGAVLDHPSVSRWHVEVVRDGDGFLVRDLGSRNGTWKDGRRIERERIAAGDQLRVGPFRIVVEPEGLVARDARPDACLEAVDVTVSRGGRRIVAPTSVSVRSGELLAIIGRSGCGKTTLVRALAGVVEPDTGRVELDGEPVAARLPDIGYLPQDEIVHRHLTPREAVRYAARLRLPADVGGEELDRLVTETLQALDLDHRAGTRIGRLSGGERKRAGLAVELVGRPGVLFLDEPTTGLDPGLEGQTMDLLARLAREGRAVVVVTHATASLERCDRLVVMGPDGRLHFAGRPADALAHFGVDRYEDIYAAVAEKAAGEPAGDDAPPAGAGPARASIRQRPTGGARQVRVLLSRYLRTFGRDRRNLAILLVQVPVLGVALGALFGADVFLRSRRGNPNDAAQLLFLLSTTAMWIGAIATAREIVKERAVLARERAVGVRVWAYLASKCALLFGLTAVLACALTAVVVALRPLHEDPRAYAAVFALVAATAVVAAATGLAVSAAARSQDQATSFIPLVLVPQLLFAGALVPVSKMGDVIAAVSSAMPSRWSFASLGTAVDLSGRLAADPYDARYSPFERTFFDVAPAAGLLALGAFALALTVLVALLLARRR